MRYFLKCWILPILYYWGFPKSWSQNQKVGVKENPVLGCVPLPEWTRMDIITGMDYRNGHYAMALDAFNVFCLHKMYFCSHMNNFHQIKSISV